MHSIGWMKSLMQLLQGPSVVASLSIKGFVSESLNLEWSFPSWLERLIQQVEAGKFKAVDFDEFF